MKLVLKGKSLNILITINDSICDIYMMNLSASRSNRKMHGCQVALQEGIIMQVKEGTPLTMKLIKCSKQKLIARRRDLYKQLSSMIIQITWCRKQINQYTSMAVLYILRGQASKATGWTSIFWWSCEAHSSLCEDMIMANCLEIE